MLITGHTGFKGSWLCELLLEAGAEVTGYALESPTEPALFTLADLGKDMRSVTADIRDLSHLQDVFRETQPEIVFHLAAQPIVRASYENPVYTYETNVMGTVHLLECVRQADSVRSVVNVTTDKVYRNDESGRPFREEDILCGLDPYANSKSCSELVTEGYKTAFFGGYRSSDRSMAEKDRKSAFPALSTVRSGNVIGGGDFGRDRLLPDCMRAILTGEPLRLRNPESVRPFQHVLEPLHFYLQLAQAQAEDPTLAGAYNIGPTEDALQTEEIVRLFFETWEQAKTASETPFAQERAWQVVSEEGPREATLLRLDTRKACETFSWQPTWTVAEALEEIAAFLKTYQAGEDIRNHLRTWIRRYQEKANI